MAPGTLRLCAPAPGAGRPPKVAPHSARDMLRTRCHVSPDMELLDGIAVQGMRDAGHICGTWAPVKVSPHAAEGSIVKYKYVITFDKIGACGACTRLPSTP